MVDEAESAAADKRPTRKVAILGTTPSRMQAPIYKEGTEKEATEWEIWTIGPGGKDHHRWDRLFEIHCTWPKGFEEYLKEIAEVEAPQQVWSLLPIPGAKSNTVLSRDILFERYGRTWFSSSISYCLAVAIHEKVTDIGCWGIDLESGEEYISQFIGAKHFLDMAREKDITVHLPEGCGLLRDPTPYPDRYENLFSLMTEKKIKWLNLNLDQMRPNLEQHKASYFQAEGYLRAMRELGGDAEKIKEREEELNRINANMNQIACNLNSMQGELSSSEFWRRMFVYGYFDPDQGALLADLVIK